MQLESFYVDFVTSEKDIRNIPKMSIDLTKKPLHKFLGIKIVRPLGTLNTNIFTLMVCVCEGYREQSNMTRPISQIMGCMYNFACIYIQIISCFKILLSRQ